jgi:hypothetical protein
MSPRLLAATGVLCAVASGCLAFFGHILWLPLGLAAIILGMMTRKGAPALAISAVAIGVLVTFAPFVLALLSDD